jgi:bifunctional DNase/RNase
LAEEPKLLPVQVKGFVLDKASQSPIVLLQPEDTEEVMLIWIGPSEAHSIALLLSGAKYERPLTHDLLKLALDGLDARHRRTEITHLESNTFFARVLLQRGNDFISIDCRPSDGIAMALRSEADIFVDRELFESQKQVIQTSRDGEAGESGEED